MIFNSLRVGKSGFVLTEEFRLRRDGAANGSLRAFAQNPLQVFVLKERNELDQGRHGRVVEKSIKRRVYKAGFGDRHQTCRDY